MNVALVHRMSNVFTDPNVTPNSNGSETPNAAVQVPGSVRRESGGGPGPMPRSLS